MDQKILSECNYCIKRLWSESDAIWYALNAFETHVCNEPMTFIANCWKWIITQNSVHLDKWPIVLIQHVSHDEHYSRMCKPGTQNCFFHLEVWYSSRSASTSQSTAQHLKVDDLVLKITIVILQLVNIKRTKLVLIGSRNPIYLNMSFRGVLFVWVFLLIAGGYCSYILSQCLEAAYLLPCTSHCYSNQCSVELCVLTVRSVLTLGLSPCRCCWDSEEDSVFHRSLWLATLRLAMCSFQGTMSGWLIYSLGGESRS